MWNGSVGRARAVFLAALIVSIGGCDGGAAPLQVPKASGDAPRSQPPRLRYQVDRARDRVWFLTRDGVFFYDLATPERIVVALPTWQWVGMPYSCLPDLALGPKGEAVITSNILPKLWRIDPETLAASVHDLVLDADADKDVGFSGLVYSVEHDAFFAVSYSHGSLWQIDPLLRRGRKIPLSAPVPQACGLAVAPRVAPQRTTRGAGLCARGPEGGWTIDLAPDQRSAYVRAAPCTDR